MNRAIVHEVDPDAVRAKEFLARARVFLADADRDCTALESAVVLYWQSCISAMDAMLAAGGLRLGDGIDTHSVRVETALSLAGDGYSELFERLDHWRRDRHGVSYAAVTPPANDVAAMQTDARDVIALAAQFIDSVARR